MKTPGKTDNRSTVGGPAHQDGAPANDFTAKLAGAQELAAAMPYNTNKALEIHSPASMPAMNRLTGCGPIQAAKC